MALSSLCIYKISAYLNKIDFDLKFYVYECAECNEHMAFTSMKITVVSFSFLMLYLVCI